jgi:hypothetical protein
VRFSTGFDVFNETIAEAGKEKKDEARGWVEKFTAAGGTNINDALKAALDLRPKADDASRPFVIVFITDGQGNQPAEDTIKMVLNHAASKGSRIFSFGVGHDVNTVFLDQLATQHTGKPTYVQPGENLELVLGDFFSVISQPVLTNLKLTLPEIGATEKFPAGLGDLYHGQQLIVAGRFEKPTSGDVKLTAMRDGKEVEFAWPNVSFNHTAEAKYVPAIWAGRKIAFLLDQIRASGENQEMVGEVIALSTDFGIQTPYTSWLVNPEQRELAWRDGRRPPPRDPPMPLEPRRRLEGSAAGAGRPATPAAQRGAMSGAGVETGEGGRGGGMGGGVAMDEALREEVQAMGGQTDDFVKASGEGATKIAQRNAEMRDSRSRDKDRVNQNLLAFRKIGDLWYNRVGRFWVDERIDQTTHITVVKFGSDAYFTLVERCPDLRPALAEAREIAVVVSEGHAVIVSENEGIEAFTPEQLQQAGLPARKE